MKCVSSKVMKSNILPKQGKEKIYETWWCGPQSFDKIIIFFFKRCKYFLLKRDFAFLILGEHSL